MHRLTQLPEVGDLVVCAVAEVQAFGAFVTLDEYDNKTGFIHISEIASGWIKHMSDFIRIKQKIVCKVLHVDPVKGHIDLSLKQVNAHQKREKIQQWKNEQRAEKFFEIVAKDAGADVEACYKEFGYKLMEKFGSLYAAFEVCANDHETLKKHKFKGAWIEKFVKVAQDNIVLPSVEIDGYLTITSSKPNGVESIRDALEGSLEDVPEETPSSIQYVGAPVYRIVIKASDYKTAEASMKKISDAAIAKIKKAGGEGSFERERKA
ncbi:MAG: translation initiation factor IF-2 subunit alpha [Candidatus Thermoplasmatota archaeon]|nr:translation initiation factor IF-2 subunit alpha [Candidatus Thermoplasmatota archaeon]